MDTKVRAIYRNGVLELPAPLPLQEGVEVEITVSDVTTTDSEITRQHIHEILVAEGLSLPRPQSSNAHRPLSAQRRAELAEIFSKGGPLSDLILEERDER